MPFRRGPRHAPYTAILVQISFFGWWKTVVVPLLSNHLHSCQATTLHFVIPTEPGFPATHRRTQPRVLLSLRKAAWSAPTPPSSTGNPGERSEGRDLQFALMRNGARSRVAHDTFAVSESELQVPPLRYPGFPVELGGAGELHAAFFTESRTRGRWSVPRSRKPGCASVGMTKVEGGGLPWRL